MGSVIGPLSKTETAAIDDLFQEEPVRKLVPSLRSRDFDVKIKVFDSAYWIKGCSSLGKLRFAVLLEAGTGKRKDTDFCLMDINSADRDI